MKIETVGGRVAGVWRGKGPVAQAESLDVELDLPVSLDWSDVDVRPEAPQTRDQYSKGTWIEGLVLAIDELGVVSLDVSGAMMMIETTGQPPAPIVGLRIRVPAESLEIYPTGL